MKISKGRKGGCKCFRKDLVIATFLHSTMKDESANNEVMKFCETRLVCMLHL